MINRNVAESQSRLSLTSRADNFEQNRILRFTITAAILHPPWHLASSVDYYFDCRSYIARARVHASKISLCKRSEFAAEIGSRLIFLFNLTSRPAIMLYV